MGFELVVSSLLMMQLLGVFDTARQLLSSYLVDGTWPVDMNVLQGSVLGLLLFTMYIILYTTPFSHLVRSTSVSLHLYT